jgi:hypothetical protein
MGMHAAAARYRLGENLKGEEGKMLIHQAVTWIEAQKICNPARAVAVFAPGFPTQSSLL